MPTPVPSLYLQRVLSISGKDHGCQGLVVLFLDEGLASWESDGHGAIDTQTLVGYVCMGVSKSVVDGRGV